MFILREWYSGKFVTKRNDSYSILISQSPFKHNILGICESVVTEDCNVTIQEN